jgi:hypothetical protein
MVLAGCLPNKKEPSNQSQFNAQAAAASKEHVEYKIINDTYLKPIVKVALRWLKPLGYADVIKKCQHTTCHMALWTSQNSVDIQ